MFPVEIVDRLDSYNNVTGNKKAVRFIYSVTANILIITAKVLAKVMSSQVFVCQQVAFSVSSGVSIQGGLCPGGLCPRGSLSRRVSVQGVSVQGNLCPGVSVRETPRMVKSRWYASYWNAFLSPCISLSSGTQQNQKKNFTIGIYEHFFTRFLKFLETTIWEFTYKMMTYDITRNLHQILFF